MAQIDQFLKVMVEQGGSDLHLTVGSPPVMRVHGKLQRIKFRELSNTDMESLIYEIMEEEWRITFVVLTGGLLISLLTRYILVGEINGPDRTVLMFAGGGVVIGAFIIYALLISED